MGIVDVFADAGQLAAADGVLPDALAVLAVRLDLAGAGALLTEITDRTCWAATHGAVAGCRCQKGNPDPRPIPPPPPPPPEK